MNPVNLFIQLPVEEETARAGWVTTDKKYGISGNVYHYNWNPDASSMSDIVIDLKIETPLDSVYLLESKGELHYDAEYLLPVAKKIETIRGYGKYSGKSTIEIKLDSITKFEPDEFMDLEKSLYTYLEAESTYYAIIDNAEIDANQINEIFVQARQILDRACPGITDKSIRKELDLLVSGYNDDTLDLRARSERTALLLCQPEKNWMAKDLNGKIHKLKNYQGKVVLLDFWYRGCPWCMHSLAPLMRVFDKYKDEAFVLLGMNVDKDENDARFVVEKMQIEYTNLLARDIAKEYDITGYPTILIIGQDGRIKNIHIGWSKDLFDRISESIDKLLE
jgi:thiol-disulfide isomerase/thioredoxin